VLIAQISDLHLSVEGSETLDIAPMAKNLKLCVKHINQLPLQPDLVLVTGDISNSGLIEELIYAKTLLDQFAMPYFVIPGNHDNRQDLLTIFGKQSCQENDDQLINYCIDGYELKLIGIDSSIAFEPGGEFKQTTANWLEQQLQGYLDHPVVLFMHHPPIDFGIAETKLDGFNGQEYLANLIKKHSNIEAILCGHIHLAAHTRWHGTVVSTAPSIGMRLVIDFNMEHQSQFILDEPNYQIHYWTESKNLVTYNVNINDTHQGYPFT